MKWFLISAVSFIILTGCISIDKERAAERRKAELCAEIDTQKQPQCAGYQEPPIPNY